MAFFKPAFQSAGKTLLIPALTLFFLYGCPDNRGTAVRDAITKITKPNQSLTANKTGPPKLEPIDTFKNLPPAETVQGTDEKKIPLSKSGLPSVYARVRLDKEVWEAGYKSGAPDHFEKTIFSLIDRKTDSLLSSHSIRADSRAFALQFRDLFFDAFESDIEDIRTSEKLMASLNLLFNASAKRVPAAERIAYFNGLFMLFGQLFIHYENGAFIDKK